MHKTKTFKKTVCVYVFVAARGMKMRFKCHIRRMRVYSAVTAFF